MACWRTWALVNWQMTPYSLQKHLSAEYTMCTEPTLSMQHGTCCSPRQGNQKQWPNKWCAPFSLEESPLSIDDTGEMTTALHLSSLRPQKWDGDVWIQNCSPYWWHWVRYQTVASRWSHVHVVNSARLVVANARSQDCHAHQCVHASIRRVIRRLAWIGIHEDWLRYLKAVHAGVPTPGK